MVANSSICAGPLMGGKSRSTILTSSSSKNASMGWGAPSPTAPTTTPSKTGGLSHLLGSATSLRAGLIVFTLTFTCPSTGATWIIWHINKRPFLACPLKLSATKWTSDATSLRLPSPASLTPAWAIVETSLSNTLIRFKLSHLEGSSKASASKVLTRGTTNNDNKSLNLR